MQALRPLPEKDIIDSPPEPRTPWWVWAIAVVSGMGALAVAGVLAVGRLQPLTRLRFAGWLPGWWVYADRVLDAWVTARSTDATTRLEFIPAFRRHPPASERGQPTAQDLHSNEDEAKAVGASWCHRLKHEGGTAVLADLRAMDVSPRSELVREAHRELLVYFENQVHRMDYPRYRSKGWPIGSGPVEAACKQVVNQRLKGTGMRWCEPGADAVCHLRALFRSEKGQWQACKASLAV